MNQVSAGKFEVAKGDVEAGETRGNHGARCGTSTTGHGRKRLLESPTVPADSSS